MRLLEKILCLIHSCVALYTSLQIEDEVDMSSAYAIIVRRLRREREQFFYCFYFQIELHVESTRSYKLLMILTVKLHIAVQHF
jgi:hypothetical protein